MARIRGKHRVELVERLGRSSRAGKRRTDGTDGASEQETTRGACPGERMGEERSRPGEEVEVSSAKAGRAPGRHYLLTSSNCSLTHMLLDALT